MQLPTSLNMLLLGIVSHVLSAPIDSSINTDVAGAPGNPGSLYLCNGINWTGGCQYIDHDLINGGCMAIAPAFARAKSIGADYGPVCIVYSESECGGVGLDVTYPGITDADDVYGWPGTVASFACQFMFDPPK